MVIEQTTDDAADELEFQAELDALGLSDEAKFSPPERVDHGEVLLPPMSAIRTQGDYITLFDAVTGEPSTILRLMAPKVLNWISPDTGGRRFTVRQKVAWQRGNTLCLLHKDHPDRKMWDSLGLTARVCRKATLMTDIDLETHMLHKHKQEQTVIQRYWDRQREREDREFQREQMRTLTAAVQGMRPLDAMTSETAKMVDRITARQIADDAVAIVTEPIKIRKPRESKHTCKHKGVFGRFEAGCPECDIKLAAKE